MISLHVNNQSAKKRGVGKNLLIAVRTGTFQEQVNMVDGNFNGAAWRRQSGNEHRHSALSRKPSPTRAYLFRRAPNLCGDQEMCQASGLTCAVLRKPPGSENEWQIRMHGAFTIPHDTLGITRRNRSCHTILVHLLHVEAGWLIAHPGMTVFVDQSSGRGTRHTITIQR